MIWKVIRIILIQLRYHSAAAVGGQAVGAQVEFETKASKV
jgi:hypothetical protein